MRIFFIVLFLPISLPYSLAQIKSRIYTKEFKSYSYKLILYENKEFKSVESYKGGMQMVDCSKGSWVMKNDTLILNTKKLGANFYKMRWYQSQEKFILKKKKLKTLTRDNHKLRRPVLKLEK